MKCFQLEWRPFELKVKIIELRLQSLGLKQLTETGVPKPQHEIFWVEWRSRGPENSSCDWTWVLGTLVWKFKSELMAFGARYEFL